MILHFVMFNKCRLIVADSAMMRRLADHCAAAPDHTEINSSVDFE